MKIPNSFRQYSKSNTNSILYNPIIQTIGPGTEGRVGGAPRAGSAGLAGRVGGLGGQGGAGRAGRSRPGGAGGAGRVGQDRAGTGRTMNVPMNGSLRCVCLRSWHVG